MFNIITNVKNRNVVGLITLEELVTQLKNPSVVQKKIVDKARLINKESPEYANIKSTLPCFVPNFRHKDYIKIKTIESSTGFIYIDVDYDIDIDFSKFSFVASSWKSLSNIGRGILVALENVDEIGIELKSMRDVINTVCSLMDIKPDNCAVSRDRLNVIGYDYNTYYNPNYTKLYIEVDKSVEKVDKKKKIIITQRLVNDVHFYDGDLRLTNLCDFTEKYVFEDDELYKDVEDNPIKYTQVFIPKTLPKGQRNSRMYKILSTVRGLNPMINLERLYGLAKHINNTRCYEPLPEQEVKYMCSNIFTKEIVLFSNKVRKYIYNPIYVLTGRERTTIAGNASREKKALKTTVNLLIIVESWDTKVDGKLTYKSLSEKSGVSYKTVLRRKKELKDL